MSAPFALYVHVPWCRHVCPYCDFNVVARAQPPEDAWRATIAAELRAHAAAGAWAGRCVKSVFLGGGTPSLLEPATIGAVLSAVADAFGLEPDAEVTLEANPGTVTADSLAGYRTAGVTRLSLGAQSFQPALLATLGRDHAPADTVAAMAAARAAGLADVSLDLIFAVPGETLALWEEDLARAVALEPTHVSAYALTWEEGTPFHAWRARGRLVAVDEDAEAAMADAADERLTAAGYGRYEISSWARPGFASRHNTSYWDGSDYLGVGPGAHSFVAVPTPQRSVAVRDPDAWRAAVERTGSGVGECERLTPAIARAEFVITGLRRVAGADADEFVRRFGLPLDAAFPHVVQLVADGLVEAADGRLRLTPAGRRFADSVWATFL